MTTQERKERCRYLYSKVIDNMLVNPEQAEAYRERFNKHRKEIEKEGV